MTNHQVFTSKTHIEKHHFTWKIGQFAEIRSSKRLLELHEYPFELGVSIGVPSKWRCYLECSEFDNKDWIGIIIDLDQNQTLTRGALQGVISMSAMIGQDGSYFIGNSVLKRDIYEIRYGRDGCGYHKAIPQNISEDRNHLPLDSDGSLTIDFEVKLFKVLNSTLPSLISRYGTQFRENLLRDMETMYKTPDSLAKAPATAKLICNDGKKFVVNPAIMAARSPVFLPMFKPPWLEAEGVVKIYDISGSAMGAILEFIYTAKLPDNWNDPELIEEFAYAANKYMLQDLLEFLDQVLALVCTPNNCGSLLEMAIELELKKAETDLLKYCQAHRSWEELKQLVRDCDSDLANKRARIEN